MPSRSDGTEDGLAAFRKAFFEEEEAPASPPHDHKHWKHITLLAIDEFTVPSARCPNGHIVQWVVQKGEPEESRVSMVARYPREILMQNYENRDPNFLPVPVCVTCGEDGVDNGEEANS